MSAQNGGGWRARVQNRTNSWKVGCDKGILVEVEGNVIGVGVGVGLSWGLGWCWVVARASAGLGWAGAGVGLGWVYW